VTLWLDRLFTSGIIFLILATPFAFGAVQAWAYTAMEVVIFALVILWMVKRALLARASGANTQHLTPNTRERLMPLALPLALFIALCAMQLVPLPPSLLKVISPSTFEVYKQSLPGWPESAPYAELLSMEQGAGSEEPAQSAKGEEQSGKSEEESATSTAQANSSPLALTPLQPGAGSMLQAAANAGVPNTQHPTPDTQHPTPDTRHLAPALHLHRSNQDRSAEVCRLRGAVFSCLALSF
jgi:hypothetical protein